MRCFFYFKIRSNVFFSAENLTCRNFFLKIIVLRKARQKQTMSFSCSKRRQRDFLCANFFEIRDAKKPQIQNLKRFFTIQYLTGRKVFFSKSIALFFQLGNWHVVKVLIQNPLRCHSLNPKLTYKNSFNPNYNALCFFNFKACCVVSFISKSDKLYIFSVQNLTRCKILDSKSDPLWNFQFKIRRVVSF